MRLRVVPLVVASDNCYLIRHDKGLLLSDTAVPDAVASMPDGMVVANGAITRTAARKRSSLSSPSSA